MKIKVNTEIIAKFDPCQSRFDNWKAKYPKFNGDITKFLRLTNITHFDKMWVAMRLIPLEMRVVFALDSAFSASAHAAYAAAAYAAADAAAYAAADAAAAYAAADAYAADADAARKKEESNQIDVLIYLIKGE